MHLLTPSLCSSFVVYTLGIRNYHEIELTLKNRTYSTAYLQVDQF